MPFVQRIALQDESNIPDKLSNIWLLRYALLRRHTPIKQCIRIVFILGKTEQQNSFAQKVTPNQWHIFGMEWTPAYITMYVDGKITGTFLKSNDSEEIEEGQWTFDRPYYIIHNQSVGDDNWNTPMLNAVYETEIDWIKVYQ